MTQFFFLARFAPRSRIFSFVLSFYLSFLLYLSTGVVVVVVVVFFESWKKEGMINSIIFGDAEIEGLE